MSNTSSSLSDIYNEAVKYFISGKCKSRRRVGEDFVVLEDYALDKMLSDINEELFNISHLCSFSNSLEDDKIYCSF